MGETRDTTTMGRGRTKGGGNVLQGGVPSDSTVWFVDVGPFSNNGE